MKQLLIDAKNEILSLRRQNEILSAQMAVVDVFAAAVGLQRNSQGFGTDVVQDLDNAIRALDMDR